MACLGHSSWRRVTFFQQGRLFFRLHSRSKLIVLGWVNDTSTKRAYGSRGHPPNDWEELVAASLHCSVITQVELCETRWPGGSYSAKS